MGNAPRMPGPVGLLAPRWGVRHRSRATQSGAPHVSRPRPRHLVPQGASGGREPDDHPRGVRAPDGVAARTRMGRAGRGVLDRRLPQGVPVAGRPVVGPRCRARRAHARRDVGGRRCGPPSAPASSGNDTRAHEEAAALGDDAARRITGNTVFPRLHRAQAGLGPSQRTGDLRTDPARAASEGTSCACGSPARRGATGPTHRARPGWTSARGTGRTRCWSAPA